MSEAAGMRRLRPNELDPEIASTFGFGEMILGAAKRGAQQIIIGLGGSATNDGGCGMARSLGFRFRFEDEEDSKEEKKETPHLNPLPLRRGEGRVSGGKRRLVRRVSELATLARIEEPNNLSLPKIIAAVDVRNPLLGKNGATRIFGPQKGVTLDKIDTLERALTKLADVVTEQFGFDYRNETGAGAAGGLGFGLMSFCRAKIRPGFDVVAETVGLESKMKDVDLVITGEGSLDRQTLEGKTPAGVARLARKLGKRVFAMVGRTSDDPEPRQLFDGLYQNARAGMSTEENMRRAAELLRENARELATKL